MHLTPRPKPWAFQDAAPTLQNCANHVVLLPEVLPQPPSITKEEEQQQNEQNDEDSSSDDSSENDEIQTLTDDSDDDQIMKINNIFYGLENISYDTPDEDK